MSQLIQQIRQTLYTLDQQIQQLQKEQETSEQERATLARVREVLGEEGLGNPNPDFRPHPAQAQEAQVDPGPPIEVDEGL